MSAPTEEEIRAAIEAEIAEYPSDNGLRNLGEAIDRLADPIDWHLSGDEDESDEDGTPHQLGDNVWRNLRPTEAARLRLLVERAKLSAFAMAREAIVREIVAAGLTFAAEYPDAPRARREVAA
jgi:hypothetical protein